MSDAVVYSVVLPELIGPKELLDALTRGFAEIGADPVVGHVALLLTVPAAHAEQVEMAASKEGLKLQRVDR